MTTATAPTAPTAAEQQAVLEASTCYVPLALFRVHASPSAQNLGHRSDRDAVDAVYCLPLYKLRWLGKTPRVAILPLPKTIDGKPQDPMRKLSGKGVLPAVEAEEARLIKQFGKATFYQAFPGDTFREAFAKAARLTNPVGAEMEKRKALQLRRARAVARTVISVEADDGEAEQARAATGG